MQKDKIYHQSAVQYNEELAFFAEGLAERIEHEEVQRWCRSVGKQHRFHAKRHQNALAKLDNDGQLENTRADIEGELGDEDAINENLNASDEAAEEVDWDNQDAPLPAETDVETTEELSVEDAQKQFAAAQEAAEAAKAAKEATA